MALLITGQARAILWAQRRAVANIYFRRNRGMWFIISGLFILVWYGMWSLGAFALATIVADPGSTSAVREALPLGLLAMLCYWQVVPMVMASTGLSLDLGRLLVYPIPHAQLFTVEVLLRVTTAIEMVILCVGLAVGLARNPLLP